MSAVLDFIRAAFPWAAMELPLLLPYVQLKKQNPKNKLTLSERRR